MIRILIITNDIKDWIKQISCWCRGYTIKKYNGVIFIISPLLHVAIASEINDRSQGQRWNTIILDKNISEEIYQQVLLPSLRNIIDLRYKYT